MANTNQSTGPRTVEGKARSSQNALKSGMYSQTLIIRGENYQDYDRLSAEYFQRFSPATPELRDAVDRLVFSVWLLRRYAVVQAQLFAWSLSACNRVYDEHAPGQAFWGADQQLTRLQRIVNSTHRNHDAALKEVERLHKLALDAPPEVPSEVPQPEENKPDPVPPQFVPSRTLRTRADVHGSNYHDRDLTEKERLTLDECPYCFPKMPKIAS
jgi:hypothetical protein